MKIRVQFNDTHFSPLLIDTKSTILLKEYHKEKKQYLKIHNKYTLGFFSNPKQLHMIALLLHSEILKKSLYLLQC
jgi:hypothetical protein